MGNQTSEAVSCIDIGRDEIVKTRKKILIIELLLITVITLIVLFSFLFLGLKSRDLNMIYNEAAQNRVAIKEAHNSIKSLEVKVNHSTELKTEVTSLREQIIGFKDEIKRLQTIISEKK